MKIRHAVLAVAILSGCGESTYTRDELQPRGFEASRQSAENLGEYLGPVAREAGARMSVAVAKGMDLEVAKPIVFTSLFGERQEPYQTWGGTCFGNRFVMNGELGLGGIDSIRTVEGIPALVIWSIGGGAGFVYEPTIIDPLTGGVYQGWVVGNPEGFSLFGPRLPHEAARVTGTFTPFQISELEGLVQAGISLD